jgi:RNA polymerase-binding protein DksA
MTKPLTSKNRRDFIAKAGQRLKSMRIALFHELAADLRAGHSVSHGGGSLDSGDLASNELEQHMAVMLSERERERIVEIDRALKRIDESNYDLCEACGLEIAEQRLLAMPFAQRCRDCQHDQERKAKGWYRANDIEQERSKDFGSNPLEQESSRESMRSPQD